MAKIIQFTLPEFAFIEGSEHEVDNILKQRTVFQHIRSYTIIELIEENSLHYINDGVKNYRFDHINIFGALEELIFIVHYTLADDEDLQTIFENAAQWYRDYCNWEDRNISETL